MKNVQTPELFPPRGLTPLRPQNSLLIETSNKSIKNMLTASCLKNVGLIEKGQILLSKVKNVKNNLKKSHKKVDQCETGREAVEDFH